MKSSFLSAEVYLRFNRSFADTALYDLYLEFIDPFGRVRKHKTTVDLVESANLQCRPSFTAMSDVNASIGMVSHVSDLKIYIICADSTIISVPNYHDYNFSIGQHVSVVEHLCHDQGLSLIALPILPEDKSDLLRIQYVNADVLDEQGKLIFRMSVDPFHQRVAHDTRMES